MTGQALVTRFTADVSQGQQAITQFASQASSQMTALTGSLRNAAGGLSNVSAVSATAGQSLGLLGQNAASAGAGVSGLIALITAAGSGGLVGGALLLAAAVTKASDGLAHLADVAHLLGASAEDVQKLQTALFQLGEVPSAKFETGALALQQAANAAVRNGSGPLFDLFAANKQLGVSLTDNQGKVKGLKDLLADAATLISQAKTAADAIDIARLLNLSNDFVQALEKGPDALRQAQTEAGKAGTIISNDVVAKAKEFDHEWNIAIQNWSDLFKAKILEIKDLLPDLVLKNPGIQEMFGAAEGAAKDIQPYLKTFDEQAGVLQRVAKKALGTDDAEPALSKDAGLGEIAHQSDLYAKQGQVPPWEVQQAINAAEIEYAKQNGLFFAPGVKQPANAPLPPARPDELDARPLTVSKPSTVIPKTGSSSDPGLSSIDHYIISEQRAADAAKASADAYGKSNKEKEEGIALAGLAAAASRDQTTATEAQTKKVRELADTIAAEKDRTLQMQRQTETVKYFGDTLVDSLDQALQKGASFASVMQSVVASLEKAALQSLILGQGPLASLFGTAPATSNGVGGIFGSIFSGGLGSLFGGAGKGAITAGGAQYGPLTGLPVSVPGFADGGVVPGNPGDPVLALVHGGEKISNLAQQRAEATGGGAPITYAPTTHIYASGLSAAQAQAMIDRSNAKIVPSLAQLQKRTG